MKVALCLLALVGVAAQLTAQPTSEAPTTETPVDSTEPPTDSTAPPGDFYTTETPVDSTEPPTDYYTTAPTVSVPTAAPPASYYTTSSGSGDVGYSGGSGWDGSGSGWDWNYNGDGDAGWDPSKELWHFRPSWNWDSPYPPEGTTYTENWGNPPTRDTRSRRSFNFGANKGVSLVGATAEGSRADCGWRDWCVHLTFHSSYGVLSDFDAFVLDRYDSAERIYGDGFWYARDGDEGPPRVFAPMVLGGFTPEERAVMSNISKRKVKDMARRFNETRTTTWTLYPESDEMDVVLSFKQLFTLLPGYPNGNATQSELNRDVIDEWGASDQVLLRVTAKRDGRGATSSVMPRVLNFTGSQLFQAEYFSSLEYPQDDDNLTAPANALSLDVVFGRRRYGSGLPWNPARPSDACDACNQQVMNHPMVTRCLHGNVPESIFQSIYGQSANETLEWDGGEWEVGDEGAPSYLSYPMNDVVNACFGLRWLLSGHGGDGSWSSGSGFPDAGDRRSSSGSGFGDAGYGWSSPGSGSGRDMHHDGSRWASETREPVYRYDESGSRWSSWGYQDAGSAPKYSDKGGSRWSSSGSAGGGPDAGDWPSVRDLRTALAIARETDAGIQCFVESRCPVGSRNFAEAAGRMVVLEHQRAFVRVNFTEPNYRFYLWMALEELGPEGQFTTPELSSEHSPEEIAELIAGAVPNASDYNLAVDVRVFNNSEIIDWVNMFNEWIMDYYNSGGSTSEASAAWSSYSASSSDGGSSFQFPPMSEASSSGFMGETSGFSADAGPNSESTDGSAPDVGDGSDNSDPWWFADPFPVPDPQFTVEISLRNVSVVPNILDVLVVGDDHMDDSASSNMSWDAHGSELRFQLAPLNVTTFEYVPPPAYVNLTWDEETPEYPDPYWNGSSPNWDDYDTWGICSECTEAYHACDNSTSCSLGLRAFLQEALSPSRFETHVHVVSNKTDDYNRQQWGADLGPRIRQSAAFFTADGYDLFIDFMVCLSQSACDLDLSRQAYSYYKGDFFPAMPTLLEIEPARSVFAMPLSEDQVVMKFRGVESTFLRMGTDFSRELEEFINSAMTAYDPEESLWSRNPSEQAWAQVHDVTGDYDMYDSRVISVTFAGNFFVESEPPRFRPLNSDGFNELSLSNWKANVAAYRGNQDGNQDEHLWDTYPLVTWRKLSNWLYDLGSDPDFSYKFDAGNVTTEDIPICPQCMQKWTECVSNQSCADAMRYKVLGTFSYDQYYSTPRSSIDVSASVAYWHSYADSEVYARVLALLSCLSAELCPVGYALPSEPEAPLVPATTKLVTHFAVTLPAGGSVEAFLKDDRFDFVPQLLSVYDMENWLRSWAGGNSDVKVQAEVNDTSIRYEITYYPAVAEIPVFYLREDQTSFDIEGPHTFASFQLSSNRVQYGQGLSWNLLYYWFGLSETWSLFYNPVDIFSGYQVCHGCPECWEAVTRCQNDGDCLTSVRDVVAPLLRNATLPLSASRQSDGRTQVKLDLSPALLSLHGEAFQSHEGWLAFAHLLHAMSSCGCEVGFGQTNSQGVYLEPTRVRIESEAVELRVRLYATTKLEVWLGGNLYLYDYTDESGSSSDAADSFFNWFSLRADSEPFYLRLKRMDTVIDDMSESATLFMKLYGLYDEASDSQPLVNPSWIPTFVITSEDVSYEPPAEVVVTPWKVSLQSVDRYPPYDRLVDLLENGAASDEMPPWSSSNSGSWGSYSSGSYGGVSNGDECARCEEQRQACFGDDECRTAISNQLLPNLNVMPSSDNTAGFWYADMSDQILDGVFETMQSLEAKQKLLAMLVCTASTQTTSATQEGMSCIQKLTDADFPGVAADLEITPARSVIAIPGGAELSVRNGDSTFTMVAYGDPTELSSFMENDVLGGYDVTGVRVDTSVSYENDFPTYTIVYNGLTALSTPHLSCENVDPRVDSVNQSMQFKFTSNASDMPTMFTRWIQWLDPSNIN